MYLGVVLWGALFSVSFTESLGARILGIMPLPSYSHQVAMHPLWKELSSRGHHLTVLTTDPMNNSSLTNLTEINLHFSYQIVNAHNEKYQVPQKNFFKEFETIEALYGNLTAKQLQIPDVLNLITNKSEHFDLTIVEFLAPFAFLAFAERFKCPLIGVTTFDPAAHSYHALGNPSHPVLNPDYKLEYSGELTFFQRVKSSLYAIFVKIYINWYALPSQQLLVEQHFGTNYSNLEDTFRSASMLFVNTNPIFHKIRPLVPAVVQIGGGTHLKPPQPLPKDIQTMLDSYEEGFILFSLGTNTKSKFLSEAAREIILEVFAELPYRILWKYELDDLPGKPDNVVTLKWLPQQDIMRHPNIKLFITQGGLQSLEEAIYSHIPMVGIPFTRDQIYNVKKIVSSGLGLSVDYQSLTKSTFKQTIMEVVDNKKYRNNVVEFAQLLQDQPMTGLERAIWWTEYVIRHKGAEHLRSPALDLPLYQYFLHDIACFCLFLTLLAAYVMLVLIRVGIPMIKYFYQIFKIKIE